MKGIFFLGLLTIALAVGCGKKISDGGGGATEDSVGPKSFRLQDVWHASEKTCDKTSIPVKAEEAYKIDSEHFVAVEKYSEDSEKFCKVGYVYDRILQGSEFSTVNGKLQYNEVSILKGSQAKKSCWKMENGIPTGSPITNEVIPFGPEEIPFNLVSREDGITIHWSRPKECPNTLVKLKLRK